MHPFYSMFYTLSDMIRYNQFITYDGTNLQPTVVLLDDSWSVGYTPAIYHTDTDTCMCETFATCILSQGFYFQIFDGVDSRMISNQTIPGIMVDCLPLESFMFSTLECLYNQSCIQMMIDGRRLGYPELVYASGFR